MHDVQVVWELVQVAHGLSHWRQVMGLAAIVWEVEEDTVLAGRLLTYPLEQAKQVLASWHRAQPSVHATQTFWLLR